MRKSLLLPALLASVSAFAQNQRNVQSILHTIDITTKEQKTIYKKELHFEAPNWSRDGKYFIVNSLGKLYKIPTDGSDMQLINTDFANECNNDHGISFDGKWIAISHNNKNDTTQKENWRKSTVYVLPIEGGTPRQVTTKTPSFWHGWSPDGKLLTYCAERNGNFDVYTISIDGGEEKRLTTTPGLDDGPEYSHDGKYIYYNSYQDNKMHIWRMNADGSDQKQLTNDNYSNWFPHPSPNGKWIVFISYLEDQGQQHPFGKDVKLRLMSLADNTITDLTPVFFGGQGTINVPSWSPDSKSVAFVRYRRLE